MTVTNWLQKNASTILTCLGAAGLAAQPPSTSAVKRSSAMSFFMIILLLI